VLLKERYPMKRLIWVTGLVILLTVGISFSQTQTPVNLVKVNVSAPGSLEALLELGLDVPETPLLPGRWIQVIVTDEERRMLEGMGYRVVELIHNMQQYYADRLGGRPMGSYRTYSEIVTYLDSIHTLYPNITTAKFSIGQSWEGRDIWVIKVSDNPNVDEEEPEIYFEGNIHAREVITYTLLLYTLDHLTSGYGVDTMITRLVDTREIFIAPTVNPDGLVYNQTSSPGGGGMWRKNRRNNGGSYGVDCNRNFDWRFGYDNQGSSPTPSSETYRGPYAFSEPEAQAIRDFCIAHQFGIAMDYHSYADLHMFPWCGSYDGHTPDHPRFMTIGSDMSAITGYGYGCVWETLYDVNGGSIDWWYGEQTTKNKIFALTTEIGNDNDGFWPPANRIQPLCNENYLTILYLLNVADQYSVPPQDIRFRGYSINDITGNHNLIPDPGETVTMIDTLKNWGLNTATNVQGTLSETDPYVTINQNSSSFTNMGPNQVGHNLTSFSFSISENCPVLHNIQFHLRVTTALGYDSTIIFPVPVGQLTEYYSDNFESGAVGWTHSSASGWTDQWNLSTTRSHSTSHSWKCGSTSTGNYANHLDARLESPSLPLLNNAQLTFWHWMASEISGSYPDSAYDGGIVEVSVDGGAWTLVQPEGGYPKTIRRSAGGGNPYTGPFAGSPCYAGTFDWQEATFDLASLSGDSLKVRFRFGSDNSSGAEGWYVDDVRLLGVTTGGLTPVTELVITRSGNSVTLNWVSGGTQDGYRVYRATSAEGPFTQIWEGTATSYTDSGALHNPARFYYVTAYTN
jgi:carboxypeptidase T